MLAVGLSALLVTAGCAGAIGELGTDGDGGSGPHVDSVPASAEYVAYVDAAGMASDESLRSIANAALEASSEDEDAPSDVDAAFTAAENDSGLDPTRVHAVTAFGATPENPMERGGSSAMVLSTSYTEDELVSAMEAEGVERSEETYGDTTLYVDESDERGEAVLAVLGDGTFALGDQSAVERVVDVRSGDADALEGDLKAAFEATGDGYVRFAMATPTQTPLSPDDQATAGPRMEASVLENVSHVSGSFATGDGNVTTTVNFVAASESDAQQLYDIVDGALSLYAGTGEQAGETQAALDAVSVEQDGETVTVTHTDTVERIESQVQALYGLGSAGAFANESASDSNSSSASVGAVAAGE